MQLDIETYHLPVIQHALVQRLKIVRAELDVIMVAPYRVLTQAERWMLPSNLQELTEEQLQEQVDPWISLKDTLEWLIDLFEEPKREPKDK